MDVPTVLRVGEATGLPLVAASNHSMLPPTGAVAVAVRVCSGFCAHCTSPCVGGAAGLALTCTADVVLVQPVPVWVNVNVEDPASNPETKPPLVTDAMVGLLLTQVPPELGVRLMVLPTHTDGPAETAGVGFTLARTWKVLPVQPFATGVTV